MYVCMYACEPVYVYVYVFVNVCCIMAECVSMYNITSGCCRGFTY